MSALNDQDRQAIEAAIIAGRKIDAIERYRRATTMGLTEAKQAVEEMEADLRRRSPENFVAGTNKNKTGCAGVLAGVALGCAIVVRCVIY